MTVKELLAESLAAHARYREALPQRTTSGTVIPGNPEEQHAALVEAQAKRIEAHRLDPHKTDPAWDNNDRLLLDFYEDQLSR